MDLEALKKNPKTMYLAEAYTKLEKDESGVLEMSKNDAAMDELATDELENIRVQEQGLMEQIQAIVETEKEEEEFPNEIVIEVRAGAGGDEASLFAAELAAMYQGYATLNGWSFAKVDASESDLG